MNDNNVEAVQAEGMCLFLASGATFTFKNVVVLEDNEKVLVFSYKAMSDGRNKKAAFSKQHVAGYSNIRL